MHDLTDQSTAREQKLNVLGQPLEPCCFDPLTGYFRDGFCKTDERDIGRHVICAQLTQEFLDFTRLRGNDLSTPRPEFGFPGLKAGDAWCLCALRWREAYDAGVAPAVYLERCEQAALTYVDLEILQACSI